MLNFCRKRRTMKNLSPPWLRIGKLTSFNDFFCPNALLIAPQQCEVLGSDRGHMVHSHVTSVPLVASLFLLTLEENVAYFGKITDLGGAIVSWISCFRSSLLDDLFFLSFEAHQLQVVLETVMVLSMEPERAKVNCFTSFVAS